MWNIQNAETGRTNSTVVPSDGIISVTIPDGVQIFAYVNDALAGMHHLHVKAGDTVYFEVKGTTDNPKSVVLEYAGNSSTIEVPAAPTILAKMYSEQPTSAEISTPIIKEKIMGLDNVNLFTQPYGNNNNDGLGGIAALALLGGLNNRRDGYVGDPCDASKVAVMNAGFDGINHNINTNAIGTNNNITNSANGINHNINTALQGITNQVGTGFGGQRDLTIMNKLGQIEGDVWKAEGQVQLALAQSQSEINNRIADGLSAAMLGQSVINKNIYDASAANLVGQGDIKQLTLAQGQTNLMATKDAQYAVTTAVRDDGDKTRALMTRQYEDTLNRQLAVAQEALLEERFRSRSRDVEVNVTQTVNQNQQQLQAQAQQQQQFLTTNNLLQAILCQAQVAQATNQSLIIGNTGAVVGGPQNANPTNVRA